jgi:hypothetical protein
MRALFADVHAASNKVLAQSCRVACVNSSADDSKCKEMETPQRDLAVWSVEASVCLMQWLSRGEGGP